MKKTKTILLLMTSLYLTNAMSDEVFLLTNSLDAYQDKISGKVVRIKPGSKPTLFRKIKESHGMVEVELIQKNGQSSNQKLFLSSYWFERGTSTNSLKPFEIDPHKVVDNINRGEAICVQNNHNLPSEKCSILKTGRNDIDDHMACFEHLKTKLLKPGHHSAYQILSRLYTLAPEEQTFMANIMTMYGEARGLHPVEKQMAAVMKVIENRTKVAKADYPNHGINELDVVLQNSQFSMFNPKNGNWRKALRADSEDMRHAIKVYAEKQSKDCKLGNNVCHYVAERLCHSPHAPRWTKSRSEVEIGLSGHAFYSNVGWDFNPNNRYKQFARNQDLIE